MQEDSKLAAPILDGLPPIRAEIAWAARHEMAMTIEDVLARRIGLQFFSWWSAAHAAPVVASILAKELGWDSAAENGAVTKYTGKINRWMAQAGLAPKPGVTPTN